MSKKIIIALAMAVAWTCGAQARTVSVPVFSADQMQQLFSEVKPLALTWHVGDNANYKLDIGGFIQGSMVMLVREEVFEGFWVNQDMDLGFAGKQKAEMLIDKNDGKILQYIVNGQKQEIPSQDDTEVVDMRDDNITVPAGTFDCVYVKIKDNKQNQESEVWINPTLIPITGMLQTKAQSQMGPVLVQLEKFERK